MSMIPLINVLSSFPRHPQSIYPPISYLHPPVFSAARFTKVCSVQQLFLLIVVLLTQFVFHTVLQVHSSCPCDPFITLSATLPIQLILCIFPLLPATQFILLLSVHRCPPFSRAVYRAPFSFLQHPQISSTQFILSLQFSASSFHLDTSQHTLLVSPSLCHSMLLPVALQASFNCTACSFQFHCMPHSQCTACPF